ncbi:MAG: redoxin domain-containing protein [Planctomycetota bacterium]|nr:MAG: redoxin domain-containing protein [Planctomycetota bacterium]
MKLTHWMFSGLALGAGFAPPAQAPSAGAAAQAAPRATPSELEAAYKALEKEFAEARRAYQLALVAKHEERKQQGRELTAEDRAGDPAPLFVPRFRAFAQLAKGTEWGGLALLKALELARDQVDLAWLSELVDVYANDPVVGVRAAERLGSMAWTIGSEAAEGTLRRILARTVRTEVQAAATYSLAAALTTAESLPGKEPGVNTPEREAEAKRLLALVVEKHATTKYAEQAKGALFELEHLGIGKTAPEFETVDENGKAWRLSDYRGKVTIIDFWGYW